MEEDSDGSEELFVHNAKITQPDYVLDYKSLAADKMMFIKKEQMVRRYSTY